MRTMASMGTPGSDMDSEADERVDSDYPEFAGFLKRNGISSNSASCSLEADLERGYSDDIQAVYFHSWELRRVYTIWTSHYLQMVENGADRRFPGVAGLRTHRGARQPHRRGGRTGSVLGRDQQAAGRFR